MWEDDNTSYIREFKHNYSDEMSFDQAQSAPEVVIMPSKQDRRLLKKLHKRLGPAAHSVINDIGRYKDALESYEQDPFESYSKYSFIYNRLKDIDNEHLSAYKTAIANDNNNGLRVYDTPIAVRTGSYLPHDYEYRRLLELLKSMKGKLIIDDDRKKPSIAGLNPERSYSYRAKSNNLLRAAGQGLGIIPYDQHISMRWDKNNSDSWYRPTAFVQELSHSILALAPKRKFRRFTIGNANVGKEFYKKLNIDREAAYKDYRNLEYHAHHIVEPMIWQYLRFGEDYTTDRFYNDMYNSVYNSGSYVTKDGKYYLPEIWDQIKDK